MPRDLTASGSLPAALVQTVGTPTWQSSPQAALLELAHLARAHALILCKRCAWTSCFDTWMRDMVRILTKASSVRDCSGSCCNALEAELQRRTVPRRRLYAQSMLAMCGTDSRIHGRWRNCLESLVKAPRPRRGGAVLRPSAVECALLLSLRLEAVGAALGVLQTVGSRSDRRCLWPEHHPGDH